MGDGRKRKAGLNLRLTDCEAKKGIEPLTYKYESYALPIKLFCLALLTYTYTLLQRTMGTDFILLCPEMDLNHRPIDFQSIASTAELSGLLPFWQLPLPLAGGTHDIKPLHASGRR
tara:strand:+ start:163 stop:510 length:348 start_codon:yes stop_codon:yes gene_type:complete